MKRTGLVMVATLALALAAACKKEAKDDGAAKPASGDKPAGGDKPAEPGPAPNAPPPGAGDPEHGDFTLDEATAGLEGKGQLMAKISTDKGDITCELFPDKAPKTVASFVGLARGTRAWQDPKTNEWKKAPYFDGLAFHRVIPEFMIQGGDILSRDYGNDMIGTGGPGYGLDNEIVDDLKFDRPGRLAMARTDEPMSAGSQFFITEVPKKSLSGKYTIFGQCDNLDVVKEIARVPRDQANGDKPNTPVTMRVEIFRR
jgi:peptidyl-prolyl cis-trans isomerase A (cyclophilin A)